MKVFTLKIVVVLCICHSRVSEEKRLVTLGFGVFLGEVELCFISFVFFLHCDISKSHPVASL